MNPAQNFFHHAYLCKGDETEVMNYLNDFYGDITNAPQQVFYTYEKLGIDEVREITAMTQEITEGRLLIISAQKFTTEAQNGFLKILEEPAEGLKIFLIVPTHLHILKTLASRVITLSFTSKDHKSFIPIKDFLFSSHKVRLEKIEPLIKSREEKLSQTEVMNFINAVESGLVILFKKKRSEVYRESFTAVYDARDWAGQTGFPLKNIVEYLAMVLPDFSQKK